MTWLGSFGIALLNGLLGLLLGGFVGAGCVKWFQISSFEGKSGFAIVGCALLGGIVAFVIGLITARGVAGSENPGFGRALLTSSGTVLAIAVGISLVCWLIGLGKPE